MNIWALDKPHTIKHLLLRLEDEFGKDSFHVVEPNDTPEMSVRISPLDESVTLYIYCYGQSSGHYGVNIEFPTTVGTPLSLDEEVYDDVPLNRLIDMLSLHLF